MSAGIAFGRIGATITMSGWENTAGAIALYPEGGAFSVIIDVAMGEVPAPAPRRPLGTWDTLQRWQQEEAERYLGLDNDPNAHTLFDWIRAFILNGA